MTHVLVVDDSQFMRTVVGNALTGAGFDVETASTGEEAVDAVAASHPDVVTMDVEMPGIGGIEAVERIMSTNPTSILMLSAHTARGAEATLDALERGAVDFLQKPDGSGSQNIAHLVDAVVEKVESIADADVSSLALARAAASAHSTGANRRRRPVSAGNGATSTAAASASDSTVAGGDVPTDSIDLDDDRRLEDPTVIVGASTGGPRIVERLLSRLPADLGAKVIVVQHMPAEFTERFANRLDTISEFDVREASDRDVIRAGDALVARGGEHLEVVSNIAGRLRVSLTDDERVHGVRPSIDVAMETAAKRVSDPLVGVVLTGMGRDGAAGIRAIKEAGGHTIAQDEQTSPVFGIPCQAIETGCVDAVLPANEIVDGIVDAVSTEGENHG